MIAKQYFKIVHREKNKGSINVSVRNITPLLGFILPDNQYDCFAHIRDMFCFYERVEIVAFDDILKLSNFLGYKVPDWILGTYRQNKIIILENELMKNNPPFMLKIILHEFIHIAIYKRTLGNCPVWLNEGLAVYYSNQIEDMNLHIPSNHMTDLYSLSYGDSYFYEICALAVTKLTEIYREEDLISRLHKDNDFINDDIFGRKNLDTIFSGGADNEL